MENLSKVKLSIVILTYNSSDLIANCLDSIVQYNDLEPGELEIIVVDNSAYEDTQLLKKILTAYPSVVFIDNENFGYGQGNNLGIAKAKGKYICVMNPDVILIKSIFKDALKHFSANPKLAILGGKQLGHLDTSYYIRPEKEFFIITLFFGLFFNKINFYNQRFMFLSGAFLFLDRAKFEEIGQFDENIFLYCEEPDLTLRALQKGYTTLFDKNLLYRHLIDGRNDLSDFTFNVGINSVRYYFKKFGFNYQFFINQKIFSFRIKYHIHRFLRQKDKANSSLFFYKKYKSLK